MTVESDEKFKGIFVQARKTAGTIQNNDPEGTFEAGSSSNMKALECNNVTAVGLKIHFQGVLTFCNQGLLFRDTDRQTKRKHRHIFCLSIVVNLFVNL